MSAATKLLRVLLLGRSNGYRARARRALGSLLRPRPPEHAPAPSRPEGDAPEVQDAAGAGVVTVSVDAIGPGEMIEVVAGDRPIVVCNVDGTYHAVDATCPHAGGPIGEGILEGHTVTCPWHGWAFDVRSGACSIDEHARLETWPVEVSGGRVCVRIG